MPKLRLWKKLKLPITVTGIVSFILVVLIGIILYNRGMSFLDLTDSALNWIFNVSVAVLVIAIVTAIVSGIFNLFKIKTKKR